MASDRTTIKNALKTIPEIRSISGSWPSSPSELPAIVIDLASRRTADRRDDAKYLVQHEYYVRIFANDPDLIETIFDAVEARMEALGYECTFSFDQNVDGARQMVNRYSKTT